MGYYDTDELWEQTVRCSVGAGAFTHADCQAVCDALEIDIDAQSSPESGTCICTRRLDIADATLGTQILVTACGDRGDVEIVRNIINSDLYFITLDCFGTPLSATCADIEQLLSPALGVSLEVTNSPDQCGFTPPG